MEIESTEGAGTTVELRLPLSLSVIEGFWVDVAGTDYVLPLDEVVECLELPLERPARPARGSSICAASRSPTCTCASVLEAGGSGVPLEQIVVVRYRRRRVGLGVDAIRGERQTVIKPLGRLFRSVAGHLRLDDARRRRGGLRDRRGPAAALGRSTERDGASRSETTLIRVPAETLKGGNDMTRNENEMKSMHDEALRCWCCWRWRPGGRRGDDRVA